MTLLNMGHPVPFLIIDGEVAPLPVPPIPPLGTLDWPVDEPESIDLPEGWQLFFYTDGLIETRLAPGSSERYGEETDRGHPEKMLQPDGRRLSRAAA